jgi:hypothetical protein
MIRTVVIGAVESVEDRIKRIKPARSGYAWWRITVRKKMEKECCITIFTVSLMPYDRATVENTASRL